MVTKLEKQFFDTFGIEPRQTCKVTSTCNNFVNYNDCNGCNSYKYPQITDRILLELICICPDLDEVFFTDIAKLKETLLTSYIKIYKYYTEVERLSDCGKELKHQVRTLFEEG